MRFDSLATVPLTRMRCCCCCEGKCSFTTPLNSWTSLLKIANESQSDGQPEMKFLANSQPKAHRSVSCIECKKRVYKCINYAMFADFYSLLNTECVLSVIELRL